MILNYNQLSRGGEDEDDEELEESMNNSQSSLISEESLSALKKSNFENKVKKNVFVFAAYVPPGKHLIVVRDEDID